MTNYHAVMLDETRCEFGVSVEAEDRAAAQAWLEDQYPESTLIQLESPDDRVERERAMHEHILSGGDWDDEGRPIHCYPDDDEPDNTDWLDQEDPR